MKVTNKVTEQQSDMKTFLNNTITQDQKIYIIVL